MNDFEEMQQLYVENVPRYNSVPVASNKGTPPSHDYPLKHMPNQAPPSLTLPKGYMQAGGDGALLPASNITRIEAEEIPAVEIINWDVLDKVDELEKEADNAGMEYAAFQLSKLREHIILLSQGKRN